jgi:hypothetical protein
LIPALVEEGWRRHGWHEQTKKRQEILVLPVRIELTTSPLPRECSTTELRQRSPVKWETETMHCR